VTFIVMLTLISAQRMLSRVMMAKSLSYCLLRLLLIINLMLPKTLRWY